MKGSSPAADTREGLAFSKILKPYNNWARYAQDQRDLMTTIC